MKWKSQSVLNREVPLSVQVHLVCEYLHNRIYITEGTLLTEGNSINFCEWTASSHHLLLEYIQVVDKLSHLNVRLLPYIKL